MSTAELQERQQDEVNSIAMIYGDIFTDITSKDKVWNKTPSPHFQVTVASDDPSDDRPRVSLVLDIEFTETYPLSPPLVKVLHPKNLLRTRLVAVENKIKELIKEYPEQEVGFTIISEVKFLVDEFQQTTEKVLSLDEEREQRLQQQRKELEKQEKEAARLQADEQRQHREEVTKHIQEFDYDDDSVHLNPDDLVPDNYNSYDYFVFDNVMVGDIPCSRKKFQFRAVSGFIDCGRSNLLASISRRQYIVKPYLPPVAASDIGKRPELCYLLSEIDLTNSHWSTDAGKRDIHALERSLSQVQKLNHDNVVKLLGFQIDKIPDTQGWRLRILNEFSVSSESLADILPTAEFINWGLARSWLIQLLPALEYLHNSGIVHGEICPLAVSSFEIGLEDFGGGSATTKMVKIAHPGYAHRLLSMLERFPNSGDKEIIVDRVPAAWRPPETTIGPKTDIWELGVLFLRVMLSYNVLDTTYPTPESFFTNFDPSEYERSEHFASLVYDFLCKVLSQKVAKRPSALELNASGFLRDGPNVNQSPGMVRPAITVSSESAIASDTESEDESSTTDGSTLELPLVNRRLNLGGGAPSKRRYSNQSPQEDTFSLEGSPTGPLELGRYRREFEEVGRLGKGGFGEVVKARSRIEGSFYAIKKIRYKSPKLDSLLSEVLSLARLNHQYIVRYYGAWFEDAPVTGGSAITSDSESCSDDDESDEFDSQFTSINRNSSFAVDYIGNSFEPQIHFGYDSEDEDGDDSDVFEFANSSETELETIEEIPRRQQSHLRVAKPRILYIQMEFCENNTLLNLIQQGLPSNASEYWRLFRQLLEAVSYIHSEGFIHRDLKPMNIFIDRKNDVKVGDFGLAKTSQLSSLPVSTTVRSGASGDLSTVVGTLFYTANEVATGNYDSKVDMYSLGIILFEMCWPMGTGMERASTLNNIRKPSIELPDQFTDSKYATEKAVVQKLLDHDPRKRPTANELLASDLIPAAANDQLIQKALKSLADPASPWQSQVRERLFNQPYSTARDVMFDMAPSAGTKPTTEIDYLSFTKLVSEVSQIFELHGAVCFNDESVLVPQPSSQITGGLSDEAYQLLDRSGSVLMMIYDLIYPLARHLGHTAVAPSKLWRHQYVYRNKTKGSTKGNGPLKYSTMAFDIVSENISDNRFSDGECLKVVDELAQCFPGFGGGGDPHAVLLVNHQAILDSVISFAFAQTPSDSAAVANVLSQLGIDASGDDVKRQLRDRFSAPQSAVHDLVDNFNFTVELEAGRAKLRKLMMDSAQLLKVERAMGYLAEVVATARRLGLRTPIYFNPLANYNSQYYRDGVMFQLVYRVEKARRFNRIATGGRYDHLIGQLASRDLNKLHTPHGVGFVVSTHLMQVLLKQSWARDSKGSKRHHLTNPRHQWQGSRCQVLVSFTQDPAIADSSIDVLKYLWRAGISCDRYRAISAEDLHDKVWMDGVEYVVTIRQSRSGRRRRGMDKSKFKPLRVRCVATNKDVDVDYEEVGEYLSNELKAPAPELARPGLPSFESSQAIEVVAPSTTVELNNKVMVAENMAPRGRKNRMDRSEAESDAKLAATNYIRQLASAPVVSVSLRDEVIDMISQCSIDNEDEWVRKVIYSTKDLPKSYAMTIYNTMIKERAKGQTSILLVSQRTQKTVMVDLTREK